MYRKLIQEAEATGDPARGAKCRGIRREAQVRFAVACPEDEIPTEADVIALLAKFLPIRFGCIDRILEVYNYGRRQCRKMINQPLPSVVSYDPETDTEWPF